MSPVGNLTLLKAAGYLEPPRIRGEVVRGACDYRAGELPASCLGLTPLGGPYVDHTDLGGLRCPTSRRLDEHPKARLTNGAGVWAIQSSTHAAIDGAPRKGA
jgi:hypothetical protein